MFMCNVHVHVDVHVDVPVRVLPPEGRVVGARRAGGRLALALPLPLGGREVAHDVPRVGHAEHLEHLHVHAHVCTC